MELNREQIIKALELHSQAEMPCLRVCPYGNLHYCGAEMAKDALALIKQLTEENERLSGKVAMYGEERKYHFEMSRKCIADTVREFAERVKDLIHPDADHSGYEIRGLIDQIAKEMTEGK